MVDKYKLLGKIAESGYTQRSLAAEINVSKNTLNNKINGKTMFNTKDILVLCKILNITSNKEKAEIFLSEPSHKRDNANKEKEA